MENFNISSALPCCFKNLLKAEPGVYLVGGCVRDALIGKIPADWDMAATTDPLGVAERLAQVAGTRVVEMGKPGVQIFRVPFEETFFDVSPLYGGRIETDLENRDFTINALAWEPASGRLVDPAGGRQDLGCCIRMVSEAAFKQDPLRTLRAFRLAAALELTIEPNTLGAIKRCKDRIQAVSGERIREEFLKFFQAHDAAPFLENMAEIGLLEAVLPELAPMRNCRPNRHHKFDPLTHTLTAFRALESLLNQQAEDFSCDTAIAIHPKKAALFKWAMLLHDIGKPAALSEDAAGEVHYYGHEKIGADMAAKVCQRLRFSTLETRFVEDMVRNHLQPLYLFRLDEKSQLTRRAVARFFMRCGDQAPYILIHALADFMGKGRSNPDEGQRFRAFIRCMVGESLRDFKKKSALPPLITGNDLIRELNLNPSPLFKKLLQAVETARLAGTINTREEALQAAADLLPDMDDA